MTTPFSKLPSRSRADQVRDQLQAAILRGDYPIGSKLPSERELTEMFGVSRVSVREGVRSLEAIGLVQVRHGNGCFVLADSLPSAPTELGGWLREHREEVLDMLVVRGALDELAAVQAANRADVDGLAKVSAAHEHFLAAIAVHDADLGEIVRKDIDFHVAIAAASGIGLLVDLLSELHEHLAEARRAGFEPANRIERAAEEHGRILQALLARDADEARRAVMTHMVQVRDVLSDYRVS